MAAKRPILIIEDDRAIRENLEMLLSMEGYPVWTAGNGQAALEVLQSKSELPGLIFLDLMMPVMDGREFLKNLELHPKFSDLPVIVVTAAAERFVSKAVGLMKKPLDIDQVLDAAAKYAGG